MESEKRKERSAAEGAAYNPETWTEEWKRTRKEMVQKDESVKNSKGSEEGADILPSGRKKRRGKKNNLDILPEGGE